MRFSTILGFAAILPGGLANVASAETARMSLLLDDGQTILRMEATGFPREKHGELFRGFEAAYQRTLNCPYLRENHSDLREDLIDLYESDTVVLKYAPHGLDGDCASTRGWTFGWWWINPYTVISPLAFTGACSGMISMTLFHEVIHLASVYATEEEIAVFEKQCRAW